MGRAPWITAHLHQPDLTEREQQRRAGAVDDPDIRGRIRTVGIGEYLGAAGQVAEALKLGAAGADSLGYALVLAAADRPLLKHEDAGVGSSAWKS